MNAKSQTQGLMRTALTPEHHSPHAGQARGRLNLICSRFCGIPYNMYETHGLSPKWLRISMRDIYIYIYQCIRIRFWQYLSVCIVYHKARANAKGGRKDEEQEAGDRPRGAATRQGTRARAPTKSEAQRGKP